jgi:hypothetical protein
MNKGPFAYQHNRFRRDLSFKDRQAVAKFLEEFDPKTDVEKRDKKLLTYYFIEGLSGNAIVRLKDPDIRGYSNRCTSGPITNSGSLLRIIYGYFPQYKPAKISRKGDRRVELMRKREKCSSPHIRACAFCGSQDHLEEHHMMPLCMGGDNSDENLIYLCHACHRQVSDYQRRVLKKQRKRTKHKDIYPGQISMFVKKEHTDD